jgi:hypothetical protein
MWLMRVCFQGRQWTSRDDAVCMKGGSTMYYDVINAFALFCILPDVVLVLLFDTSA